MLTEKECHWLEQKGPIWLGSSLQLGHSTLQGDSTRLGNTIELSKLLDLIERKLTQLNAEDKGHEGTALLNAVAARLRDQADKEAYLAAANERFIGE